MNNLSAVVTNPLFYIGLPFFISFFLKKKKIRLVLYFLSTVLFLLFSNTRLLKYVEEQWYVTYDRSLTQYKTYEYGIVLGGYSFWDFDRNRPEFSEIGDRLYEGIRLYKIGKVKKLVMASDGSIILKKNGKGAQGNPEGMMKYLNELGVPTEDIIMEKYANNTRENVIFTLKLLGNTISNSSVLLITSGIHMRRSVEAFQKEGIYPDCYITDTWVNVKDESINFLPSLNTLNRWSGLLHEWIGYLVYKLRGW